jgi:hypothetical protein
MCCFIVAESAFLSNEVKHHFMVNVVADIAANQLSIPHHGTYVCSALKQKIPLAFNFAVHLFLLKCSPSSRLVKDINDGFKQEVEETLPFLSQCHSILPFILLH